MAKMVHEGQYEIVDENIGRGRGCFAQILLARAPRYGDHVILKCIPIKDSPKECQLQALKEAEFLQRMVHPHIVRFIDSFLYRGNVVIVQEYCERKRNTRNKICGKKRFFVASSKLWKRLLICTEKGFSTGISSVPTVFLRQIMRWKWEILAMRAGCMLNRRDRHSCRKDTRRKITWHQRFSSECRMWPEDGCQWCIPNWFDCLWNGCSV